MNDPDPEPTPASEPSEVDEVDEEAEVLSIRAMIDDWHDAASEADEERYLGHFTEDAAFLGTDASERWTLAEFREYVQTFFPRGGWSYDPHDRHIVLATSGELAWFDEQLTNAGYGELRGTGVVRRVDGAWRLAHYSMTFTVPNEVAREVVQRIKSWDEGR